MTQQEIVEHWKQGARSALKMAKVALKENEYAHTLFNCHLAVEKALKAKYIEKFDEEPPYTHELLQLALLVEKEWDNTDKQILSLLSDYAIAARYSDPDWAKQQATKDNALQWISHTESLFERFLLGHE